MESNRICPTFGISGIIQRAIKQDTYLSVAKCVNLRKYIYLANVLQTNRKLQGKFQKRTHLPSVIGSNQSLYLSSFHSLFSNKISEIHGSLFRNQKIIWLDVVGDDARHSTQRKMTEPNRTGPDRTARIDIRTIRKVTSWPINGRPLSSSSIGQRYCWRDKNRQLPRPVSRQLINMPTLAFRGQGTFYHLTRTLPASANLRDNSTKHLHFRRWARCKNYRRLRNDRLLTVRALRDNHVDNNWQTFAMFSSSQAKFTSCERYCRNTLRVPPPTADYFDFLRISERNSFEPDTLYTILSSGMKNLLNDRRLIVR